MPDSANEHLVVLEDIVRKTNPQVIVDVGMGRGSYGWWLRNKAEYKGKLIGIEIWAPYVQGLNALSGGNRSYYNDILVMDAREQKTLETIAELHPDIIFAFDVLEHMIRTESVATLRALQRAVRKSLLVSVPIILYPQGPAYGNPHEEHKTDWTEAEMHALGCEIRGRGAATGLFAFPGGGLDKLVSVTLNTVREDADTGREHALRSIADDLQRQTMDSKQFEFVIVDGLHEHRHDTFLKHEYPFRILHVPPKNSAMVRDRRCAISAYKNTAIEHSRGQLIVTLDDASTVPPTFIEQAWQAWANRREMLCGIYRAFGIVNHVDSRMIYLDSDGKCVGPVDGNHMSPPMYGFAAFALEAAIAVNGYDEMYDGSRGLEDIDMGIRLQKAGYKIALDKAHTCEIYPQGPWSERVFGPAIRRDSSQDPSYVKCSQTTLRIQLQRDLTRANEVPWGNEEWAKVAPQCYLLKDKHCSLNGHLCPYLGVASDVEHPRLHILKNDQPIFNLKQERFKNGIL